MSVNNLDKRVTLQQPATGFDSIGQPVTGWSDVKTVWANIIYQSGFEMIRADAVSSALRCVIRIRARAVASNWQVIGDGHTFKITAIIPDPDGKHYLDLVCEANDET